MSFIERLLKAKEEILFKPHPFVNEDISFRYSYMMGLGIIAFADESVNEEDKKKLNRISKELNMPENTVEQILTQLPNIDGGMLQEIVSSISSIKHRTLFIVECYRFIGKGIPVGTNQETVISMFLELFQLDQKIVTAFQSYMCIFINEDEEVASFNTIANILCNQVDYTIEEQEYYFGQATIKKTEKNEKSDAKSSSNLSQVLNKAERDAILSLRNVLKNIRWSDM